MSGERTPKRMLKGRLVSRRKEERKEETRTKWQDKVLMELRARRGRVEDRTGWRRVVK
jgi:hypothetical protein